MQRDTLRQHVVQVHSFIHIHSNYTPNHCFDSRLTAGMLKAEAELKAKENHVTVLEAEMRSMQRKLASRDAEITRQERELNKLKSVLEQASTLMSSNSTKTDGQSLILSTIQGYNQTVTKKVAVSGQSVDPDKAKAIATPRIEKDFRSKQLIREAIMENDFLKHLAPSQVSSTITSYLRKWKNHLNRFFLILREVVTI